MCDTTNDYATHISTECATGGSAQCDGYCVDHGKECTCSCHNAWDLPQTVSEVLEWHDDLNDVIASFDGTKFFVDRGFTDHQTQALLMLPRYQAAHPDSTFVVLNGQDRTVIAERY
jgi:hypothetical protein